MEVQHVYCIQLNREAVLSQTAEEGRVLTDGQEAGFVVSAGSWREVQLVLVVSLGSIDVRPQMPF